MMVGKKPLNVPWNGKISPNKFIGINIKVKGAITDSTFYFYIYL